MEIEAQMNRLLKLEQKTEFIENKIADISDTLKEISTTLKELRTLQFDTVKIKEEIGTVKRDVDCAFSEIRKIKEKGTDVCQLHLSDIREMKGIYSGQCDIVKQSIQEIRKMTEKLEQNIKERDKLFIGLVFAVIAQIAWAVIKML